MNEMETDEVIKRLLAGVTEFLDRHHVLLEINAGERSLAHKLAESFGTRFPNHDVDCEYNRHLNEEKRLEGIKEYVRAQRRNNELADNEESFGICVSPDIIIHRRGTDQFNLVVIEIKKQNHPLRAVDYDFLKLESYINEIGYAYGLYLEFRMGSQAGVNNALIFVVGSDPECIMGKFDERVRS